jgi:hypothetical protein
MGIDHKLVDSERASCFTIERGGLAIAPDRGRERCEGVDRIGSGKEVGGGAECLHAPRVATDS